MTPRRRTAIAGEVGPTHLRFAILDRDELRFDHFVNFRCADFQSIEQALAAYLRSVPAHPDVLSLAVAGVVENDRATVAGTGWNLVRRHLRSAMSMRHVTLVRNISALALALPLLESHEVEQIGGEAPFVDRPKVALSFGHFTEAATLVPVRDDWIVLAGEAGEMAIGGMSDEELKFLKIAAGDGPMAAGNLLSNQALVRLYAHLTKHPLVSGPADAGGVFAELLANKDTAALEAAEAQSVWVGRHAANVGLFSGAEGGAYLFSDGGRHGLAHLSRPALKRGFYEGGSEAVARIPLLLVDSTTAALKGAVLSLDFDEDHGADLTLA